jgi:isopenicillin N synthase-like dioxygenase
MRGLLRSRGVQRSLRVLQPRAMMMSSVVPVIDINDWYSGDAAKRQAVADKIDEACAEIGFMTIVGHNVERKVIDDCWTQTQQYFDESVEEKERCVCVCVCVCASICE